MRKKSPQSILKQQTEIATRIADLLGQFLMNSIEDAVAGIVPDAAPKKRGRPAKAKAAEKVTKRRGRPPSSSKKKVAKRRGRPPGSGTKQAAKRRGRPPKSTSAPASAPKRRGRPPKSASAAASAPKRRGRPPKSASAAASAPKSQGRPPKSAAAKSSAPKPSGGLPVSAGAKSAPAKRATRKVYPKLPPIRDLDLTLDSDSYAKRYMGDRPGTKKFMLMLAHLAAGKVGAPVQVADVRKEWKRLEDQDPKFGNFNGIFPNQCKAKGWVKSGERGVYMLSPDWKGCF